MGTWSAAIFGNDTSCEVKEYFFEQYNLGKEPAEIRQNIYEIYAESLNDREERFNILFALAHCLWQTKELDNDFHSEIKNVVSVGDDLAVCKGLGADAKFMKEREKALNKFIAAIETPKETAKKRVKPPILVDSVYKNGCCLAFQYEDGQWGVVITVDSEYYRRKAIISYALTDIKQSELPTMQEIKAAHLIDDGFPKFKKLWLYGSHYIDSTEIARLNPYNEAFFTIIGYLPEWKNAYGGASTGMHPYSQENYQGFIAIIRDYFAVKYVDRTRTVETVEEIGKLFTT